jgi:putative transposase
VGWDERVDAFLERPLEGAWPYLWLDAPYLKVRDGGRIVSVAAIIAVAVDSDGRREIIGLGLGPLEAETFWSTFLKGLVRRGLKGVRLVISDAHEGLKHAIAKVLGATWQRCRVHWLRGALATRSGGGTDARPRDPALGENGPNRDSGSRRPRCRAGRPWLEAPRHRSG